MKAIIRLGASTRSCSGRFTGVVLVFLLSIICGGFGWPDGALAKGKPQIADPGPGPVRPDNLPPMSFLSGQLDYEVGRGWRVGHSQILFTPHSILLGSDGSGEAVAPMSGYQILLMGHQSGNVFVVRYGMVQPPEYIPEDPPYDPNIEWSEEDPTVGEGEGGPQ